MFVFCVTDWLSVHPLWIKGALSIHKCAVVVDDPSQSRVSTEHSSVGTAVSFYLSCWHSNKALALQLLCRIPMKNNNKWITSNSSPLCSRHSIENVNVHTNPSQWWMVLSLCSVSNTKHGIQLTIVFRFFSFFFLNVIRRICEQCHFFVARFKDDPR